LPESSPGVIAAIIAWGHCSETRIHLTHTHPKRTPKTPTNKHATNEQPCIIIGGGRVGQALAAMGPGTDVVVKRGGAVEGLEAGPIIVATRNDALDGIVDATPAARRKGALSVLFVCATRF
jgi:hypothetical protein